jgi:hypothetical protein
LKEFMFRIDKETGKLAMFNENDLESFDQTAAD